MEAETFILDFTHLQSLTGDDNEFMIEILELIVEQSPDVLSDMQDQLAQDNYAALGSTAHKYKSSINILGNVELLSMMNQLEIKSHHQGPREELSSLVASFEKICDQMLFAIKNKLSDLKAAV
ncbi:MAG: Hpt domain-containing protein [Bacteroidota bacterium]